MAVSIHSCNDSFEISLQVHRARLALYTEQPIADAKALTFFLPVKKSAIETSSWAMEIVGTPRKGWQAALLNGTWLWVRFLLLFSLCSKLPFPKEFPEVKSPVRR